MRNLIIYTDGACSGNPGPGGYAFVLVDKDKDLELLRIQGAKEQTTNNAMELTAIVRALKHTLSYYKIYGKTEITILSDSAYCINSVNQKWLWGWKNNNWKTKENVEIKNKELWVELYNMLLTPGVNFTFKKIKGHSGNKYNELVDKAAKAAIKNLNANKHFQEEGGNK